MRLKKEERWIEVGWMPVAWALCMRMELNSSWNFHWKELDQMRMGNSFVLVLTVWMRLRRIIQVVDDIQEHLLCDGIKKNYTTWIWHGELTDMQRGSQIKPVELEMGDR